MSNGDDSFDVTPQPVEEITDQGELDRAAVVELGKRVTTLEQQVHALKGLEDKDRRLLQRLRKYLAAWIAD